MTSAPGTSRDPAARPLELRPFRALRFSAARVGDLAAVTCPPYDVVGRDGVARWEAAHPFNVVRLILPRADAGADAHHHAARDLAAWRADGVLEVDAVPALYVYEQQLEGALTRGLVGAVSLHHPAERVVLPHEDVFPGPVEDRAALMAVTGAQLEPILLTYQGGGAASDVVDDTVGQPADLQAQDADGGLHRIWRVTEPGALAAVAADLAPRQALIADGHHRYAAYLALRDAPAPDHLRDTEHGLALLVDAARHPLQLEPIHRSVAGLPPAEAWHRARAGFHSVRRLPAGSDPIRALADARPAGPVLAVGDGREWCLLADPEPDLLQRSLPPGGSAAWRRLDAELAHSLLLSRLWGVDDTDERVGFHHAVDQAVERAHRRAGVALLLAPPLLSDVLSVAAAGERMPRKSTSFGPKPRTGLLMRLLD